MPLVIQVNPSSLIRIGVALLVEVITNLPPAYIKSVIPIGTFVILLITQSFESALVSIAEYVSVLAALKYIAPFQTTATPFTPVG